MANGMKLDDDPREDWRKYGMRNLDQWIDYLDERAAALETGSKNYHYELNDIINGLSGLLNRMAQIHYATPNSLGIREKIIPWLSHAASLPETIANTLWYNLRNPVTHTGSWSPFLSFTRRNGIPVTATIAPTTPDHLPPPPDPAAEEHILVWPDTFPVPGLSRGLGWSSQHSVIEDEDDPRLELYGIGLGEPIESVEFHVDELLVLARHARRVTEADLQMIPDRRLPGLEKLGLHVGFFITEDEWNDTKSALEVRRAEYLAGKARSDSQEVEPTSSPESATAAS